MVTLRYFGPFEARREGVEIAFPTRPVARLFALLATQPGHRWRREAVAREIWPDAEWATETVSLRTALSMLRRTLGEGVVGSDRERVWVEPETVRSDRDRFAEFARREGLETSGDRREAILNELAESPTEFLTDWESPWIVPLRHEHARAVARVALDLSRQRLASGRYEEARTLALRSLVARPGNDHAIAIAVRASVALGDRDEALELAARAGGSPELRRLAEEIERTPLAPVAPAPAAQDVLFDAFESNLREDPEAAVRFLLANAQFWWRQRELARAKELLALALKETALSHELRVRTLYALAFLHSRTSDYPEQEALVQEAERIALVSVPEMVGNIQTMKGFLLYETRCYDESRAVFDAVLREDPDPARHPHVTYARVNRGGLNWQMLRLEEAKADYAAARDRDVAGGFRSAYIRAMVDANLACIAHVEEDWGEAERRATAAREVMTIRTDTLAASMAESIYLLARVAQGDAGYGARLTRAPLELVRCGMRRMALLVFDQVAEGLAHLGRGDAARELSRAVGVLRGELGHARSPAEERCLARTLTLAKANPGPAVPPAPTKGYAELAAWTAARGDEL